MQTEFLSKKINQVSKSKIPWTHWQCDDFLPAEEFKIFQEKLCAVESNFKKRPDDIADINYMFLPDLDLAKFFLHEDFTKFLETISGESLEIHGRGLVQLRRMDANSPAFPNHVDSQTERSLVCLFYLSPDWQPAKQGELCLNWDEKTPDQASPKVIAPIANRLVLFFSDSHHWHHVRKVNDWARYSVVSEWIVQGVSK